MMKETNFFKWFYKTWHFWVILICTLRLSFIGQDLGYIFQFDRAYFVGLAIGGILSAIIIEMIFFAIRSALKD